MPCRAVLCCAVQARRMAACHLRAYSASYSGPPRKIIRILRIPGGGIITRVEERDSESCEVTKEGRLGATASPLWEYRSAEPERSRDSEARVRTSLQLTDELNSGMPRTGEAHRLEPAIYPPDVPKSSTATYPTRRIGIEKYAQESKLHRQLERI